ncbi:histidine--tRNA ligase [Acidaminococcus intestini]|uniref:histidine--tRNA ligase n=1 Tax=Acidaminococcus intestini TaxID=187327 RepID=UPI001D01CA9F|nr:histidine--tRNA ligase [Acidaminococcus intestini]MCB5827890.1 histidine--tRNA ligase [Acidaminococcus intestini]
MLTTAPRGTKDILPGAVNGWRYVESVLRDVCREFNYQEIRTPIFEHTELFQRGIGDGTDVVDKEMYTFNDRSGRSITLRPENTAAVVRSFVENKLYAEPMPLKVFYIGPMFRYDRPQAGRMRQFHQFGVEAMGSPSPVVDAETILLAITVLKRLGLKDLKLKINSVGCPKCRPQHRTLLQDYFRPHLKELCEDCQSRFDRSPLRILDCKVDHDKPFMAGAPKITDSLCEECHDHFEMVKKLLDEAGVDYEVDSTLVRGLDYYTKTAYEVQYSPLGAQSAVGGGGRYDGLVEELGGPSTPGVGFAMGLERIILALEKQGLLKSEKEAIDVFAVVPDEGGTAYAFKAVMTLREAGYSCDMNQIGRSMKAQMKQADRAGARFALIFGEEERSRGAVTVRNMADSSQEEIKRSEIVSYMKKAEV